MKTPHKGIRDVAESMDYKSKPAMKYKKKKR